MRFLLPLLLAVAAKAQVPIASKQIPELNGGLDSFHSGNRLKDSESQIATNIFWDQDDAAVKRTGQALYANISGCTSQVRGGGVLDAPNGTKYMFAACGNHAYVTTGNGTFSVIGATISTTANAYFRPGLGQIWITDGVDQLWSTDGVNVSSYPSVAIAQLDGVFQNRLVIATLVNGESTIELSGYNNGGDFTLPAVILDTSPAIFGLNGLNDGRNVTCVFDGFRNVLILWNHDEMYGLYGSGNSSFVLRKLSEIGCDEQESVQEFNGNLKWLSSHGIYNYDGANTVRVSDPIKNQILNIIGTEAGSLSITQDSQGQWQSGNLAASGAGAKMSATISPNNVIPGTSTFVQSSASSFLGGSVTNLSTNTVPVLGLSISTAIIGQGLFAPAGEWNVSAGNGLVSNFVNLTNGSSVTVNGVLIPVACPNGAATCGGFGTVSSGNSNCNATVSSGVSFYDGNTGHGDSNNTLFVNMQSPICSSNNTTVSKVYTSTITLYGLETSTSVFVCFSINSGGCTDVSVTGSLQTVHAVPTGFSLSADMVLQTTNTGGSASAVMFWVSNVRISSYSSTGSITSSTFDTGFSTPVFSTLGVTMSSNSVGSITLQQQNSTDGTSWGSASSILPGQQPSPNERYWRYIANFSTSNGTTTPHLDILSLSASTTGYFIASCLPTSPNVGWGLFQATDLPGNGSVTFAVSTGTTCDSVQQATATWTAQTINQNITVSTASYLGIRVLLSGFTQFVSTAQPTLQSITANWTSSAGRPHTASQIYNNRYWLAFTTATSASAYNNSVLVLDEQNRWSNLSGINAASFMTYNRLLYSGSSLSDGNVNTQDSGLTDFGNPILLDFKSPTYELGAFNPVDLYDLNIEAQSDPSATPSLQYFVDNDTTPYTMGTINLNLGTPGLIYSTARFGQTNAPTKTHTLSYEILDTSYSPLTFYRSMIRFTPEDGP